MSKDARQDRHPLTTCPCTPREELKVHLKPYKLPKWIDTDIKAGADWEDDIRAAVKKTRVAVFLVSPDSLASDFINDEELGPPVAAKEAGEVTIVWGQLRACAYDETPLAKIQAGASPPGKPVAGLSKSKRDASLAGGQSRGPKSPL